MGDAPGQLANGFEFFKLANASFCTLLLGAILRFSQLTLDRGNQAREIALHYVVLRADAHSLHGYVFANRSGKKDKRDFRALLTNNLQRCDSAETGHGVVRNDDVPWFFEGALKHSRIIDALVAHLVASLTQCPDEQVGVLDRILHNKQAQWNRHLAGSICRRLFIQQQPIQSQLPHGVSELHKIHRLANVAVRAEVVALQAIALFVRGGQDYDWKELGPLVLANASQYFQSVYLGQLEIEQRDLRNDWPAVRFAASEQVIQCLSAIVRYNHFIPDVVFLQCT